MIRYECDKCGQKLKANDPGRYIVKLEVYAAASHIEFTEEDLKAASGRLDDVIAELSEADPDEVENQTYRSFRFDLCDSCRKALLDKPLG